MSRSSRDGSYNVRDKTHTFGHGHMSDFNFYSFHRHVSDLRGGMIYKGPRSFHTYTHRSVAPPPGEYPFGTGGVAGHGELRVVSPGVNTSHIVNTAGNGSKSGRYNLPVFNTGQLLWSKPTC